MHETFRTHHCKYPSDCVSHLPYSSSSPQFCSSSTSNKTPIQKVYSPSLLFNFLPFTCRRLKRFINFPFIPHHNFILHTHIHVFYMKNIILSGPHKSYLTSEDINKIYLSISLLAKHEVTPCFIILIF